MANDQISLPYLIGILAISVVVIRWLFFSSPTTAATAGRQSGTSTAAGGRRTAAALRAREAAVEHIQQMFPQVDRRTILWDLQRNGGSLQATTERILAGRMETPPISFQPPPLPTATPNPNGASAPARPAAQKSETPAQPDLITRYKLQDKIGASVPAGEAEEATKGGAGAWSSSREERQALFQRRREDMILAARRKMEAKIAAEKAAAAKTTEGS